MRPTRHDLHKLSAVRLLTAPFRVLPDYLILGAQKAGTTTLYNNLIKHPVVFPAAIKEVHFFDMHFGNGVNWYRAHFPMRRVMSAKAGSITGEGSPYYLLHPLAPQRVKNVVPDAKLLVVLRNPVDRAYSHYQHERRREREALSFEEAIAQELARLAGEVEKVAAGEKETSFALRHFSYLERGKYAEQLERWFSVFPREQFLILTTDELNREFQATMARVFEFLKLPPYEIATEKRSNVGAYEKMNDSTRAQLVEYFRPHNARLQDLLGRQLNWHL